MTEPIRYVSLNDVPKSIRVKAARQVCSQIGNDGPDSLTEKVEVLTLAEHGSSTRWPVPAARVADVLDK